MEVLRHAGNNQRGVLFGCGAVSALPSEFSLFCVQGGLGFCGVIALVEKKGPWGRMDETKSINREWGDRGTRIGQGMDWISICMVKSLSIPSQLDFARPIVSTHDPAGCLNQNPVDYDDVATWGTHDV